MRGSERDALARPRGPGERDAESRGRGRAGSRPDGWRAPVRDRRRWPRGGPRGRCVRAGLRVGVGWQRRRRRRRPARWRFAGGVVELGLARGRRERTGRRGRDRRGSRETRRLPVAGGFARRRPRGGGRRVRAAGRCGPCRTRTKPGSHAQGRGPDQSPVSRRCLDPLGTSGRWRWPGSRWRFLGGGTDRPEPGDRGRTRHPARASARSPRRRSSRRARNSHSPRSRTCGHASSSARRRSRRSRTSSRSPEMGRSSRLAVGAIVAAVAAGQVAPNHLGAAVALALAAVLLVGEARPRLGVAALAAGRGRSSGNRDPTRAGAGGPSPARPSTRRRRPVATGRGIGRLAARRQADRDARDDRRRPRVPRRCNAPTLSGRDPGRRDRGRRVDPRAPRIRRTGCTSSGSGRSAH